MAKTRRGDTTTRSHSEPASHRASASSRATLPLITLLTDFGDGDYFVGAVKGVILSANPAARIVDITHDVPPLDIEAAAFILLAACSSFPAGTIHFAVVDPGVGSARRPVLIQTRDQFFVGPDNGIFSYVCEREENLGLTPRMFHLTNTSYFRQPVSPTFHGRDVFASVAAALSLGTKPAKLGTPIEESVRLLPLKPTSPENGRIEARIIHVDRFGNCVTNITQNELTAEMIAGGARIRVKKRWVTSFRTYFAEQTNSRDNIFGIWGSAGFLEIVAPNDSAAKLLKVGRGDPVIVKKS